MMVLSLISILLISSLSVTPVLAAPSIPSSLSVTPVLTAPSVTIVSLTRDDMEYYDSPSEHFPLKINYNGLLYEIVGGGSWGFFIPEGEDVHIWWSAFEWSYIPPWLISRTRGNPNCHENPFQLKFNHWVTHRTNFELPVFDTFYSSFRKGSFIPYNIYSTDTPLTTVCMFLYNDRGDMEWHTPTTENWPQMWCKIHIWSKNDPPSLNYHVSSTFNFEASWWDYNVVIHQSDWLEDVYVPNIDENIGLLFHESNPNSFNNEDTMCFLRTQEENSPDRLDIRDR